MEADDRQHRVAPGDLPEQLHEAVRGGGIEAGDGLVREQQLRLLRERARDADTLLLPAAQLVDADQRLAEQPHPLQAAEGQLSISTRQRPERAPGRVSAEAPLQNVGERALAAHEMVLLEHHPRPPAGGSDRGAGRELPDPRVNDLPRRGREAIDGAQQARLPGPRRSEQNDELSGVEIQRRRLQRRDRTAVVHGQRAKRQEGIAGGGRLSTSMHLRHAIPHRMPNTHDDGDRVAVPRRFGDVPPLAPAPGSPNWFQPDTAAGAFRHGYAICSTIFMHR